MSEANAVLDRFAPQIRWVTESVLTSFGLPDHMIEDLRQDACILVLSYAGFIKGRHHSRLSYMEDITSSDSSQVRRLLATTLRTDLSQQVGRTLGRIPPIADNTIDQLIESDQEPAEPTHEIESDNKMDETRLRSKYPELAMSAIDGMTGDAIAEATGMSRRTVVYRIAGQKKSFLSTQLRRRGIVVTGDETMDELEEAYRYAQVIR